LAQEQNEQPPLQQQILVVSSGQQQQQQRGQFYPRNNNNNNNSNNNNYAYPTSDPTVSYPRQVQHQQNYPSQHQQQHQHQHVANRIPNMHLNADNEQYQLPHLPSQEQQRQQHYNQQQPGGYLGASSYDHMNYMPPQNQNIIPTGPQTDIRPMVSYLFRSLVLSVLYTLEKSFCIVSHTNIQDPLHPLRYIRYLLIYN